MTTAHDGLAVSGLRGSDDPLVKAYDVALLDLDGVVYLQEEPVPEAATALAAARAAGMRLEFVTNNASRRADTVVRLLEKVGVAARAEEVVTSAQAAVALLAERLPAGSAVLVVGGDALGEELVDVGLRPVRRGRGRAGRRGPGLLTGGGLAAARGGVDRPARRRALGGDEHRRHVPVAARSAARQRVAGRGAGHGHRPGAGRDRRQAAPPAAPGVGAAQRGSAPDSWSAIGSTPTSRARSWAAATACSCSTGVTTPADLISGARRLRPTYVSVDLRGLLEPAPGAGIVARQRGRLWRVGGHRRQ